MEPTRIGCLCIPAFPIQIHQRDEGLDPRRPLVLLQHKARTTVAVALSDVAIQQGLRLQMTPSQIEHCCPDALLREEQPLRYLAEERSLRGDLHALTPMVELVEPGLWYLGMKGMKWLHHDEEAFLRALIQVCTARGLIAHAGAASNRFAAQVAALQAPPQQLRVVRHGQELSFLAPLPLSLAQPPATLLERLLLVGLKTFGDLAAVPGRSIERRYGAVGVQLQKLARAEEAAFLNPTPLPQSYEVQLSLDFPLTQADALVFLLVGPLEQLFEQLAREGRACAALELTLSSPHAPPQRIPLRLGAPVTRARPFIDLLRLKLSHLAQAMEVHDALLRATELTEPSTPQGDLFQRTGSPTGMALTLARLTEVLGPDAVVVSHPTPAYHPDQMYTLQPAQEGGHRLFQTGTKRVSKNGRATPPARASVEHRGPASAAAVPASTVPPAQVSSSPQPSDAASPGSNNQVAPGPANVVLLFGAAPPPPPPAPTPPPILKRTFRQQRPPLAIQVSTDADGPSTLQLEGRRRNIVHREGPIRYGGAWWEKDWQRDYFWVRLQDHSEWLIYRQEEGWFLEGWSD